MAHRRSIADLYLHGPKLMDIYFPSWDEILIALMGALAYRWYERNRERD